MLIKTTLLALSLLVVVVIANDVFPGTSCAKQPEGENWYLRDRTQLHVYYKCVNGVAVKSSCFFFFCVCIGPGCSAAEGITFKCALKSMCPALSTVSETITSCQKNPCKNRGFCVVDGAGFKCKCRRGFYGDTCQKDACVPNQCHPRGYCRRLPDGQFTCICRRGYYGPTCRNDHCKDYPCGRGYCRRLPHGTSECLCSRGWKGERCDIDMCASRPCLNNGYCSGRKNDLGYKCYCRRGFVGTYCEINRLSGSCETSSCRNGANCVDLDSGHRCDCLTGFYGIKCGNDRCKPQPCQNNGVCTRTSTGFTCTCAVGFTGKDCEVDSCNPNPCENSGTCVRSHNGYICTCLPGYRGDNCETDYCQLNRCKNGGTCERVIDGYNCRCAEGFTGTHCSLSEIQQLPFDPANYFECEYGFHSMMGNTAGLTDKESCSTWCYIREDYISQTVRRGCWYPSLFNDNPVLDAEPFKGCGFFGDNLLTTDRGDDKVYCFCKTTEGACNSGELQTIIHRLPLLQRLV